MLTNFDVERQAAQQFHIVVLAHFLAAALTKDVLLMAQLEQICVLMFSMMPRMGIPTFSNILSPFRASSSAISCGVVTMTAPVTGTFCASVNWISPVPGGISTIK